MKKFFAFLMALAMLFSMVACASNAPAPTEAPKATEAPAEEPEATEEPAEAAEEKVELPAEDVAMQYMDAAATLDVVGADGYTIIDLRKAEDYEAAHIPGSVLLSMDPAINGDTENGIETMKAGVEGKDDTLVLVCYSGKKYAQMGTNILSALGYDMSKVFTLEGGFNNWAEVNPDSQEGTAVAAPAEAAEEKIELPAEDVAMQYMDAAATLDVVGAEGYIIIDLRKAEDYEAAHIPGSMLLSMDPAVNGDTDDGIAVMKAGVEGKDDTLVLVCYSGKKYAQMGTNILSALGYDMSKVYTLEGGFNNWSEVNPDATEAGAPAEARKVYVSADWVKSVIDGGQPESEDYVILECAWGELEFDPAYTEGHIPGAVHMNTDYVEEENYWNIRTGEEIEQLMADYGITKDTTVICYGSGVTNSADDRVAFVALWAGVEDVKVLDGGLEAWTGAGYELEEGENAPAATEEPFGVEVPAHPEYVLSDTEVLDKLENDDNFRLVSIRSWDEFIGATSGYSYIDRAGEPEGAIWGHDTDDGSYANEDGTTVGLDKLQEYLGDAATTDNELSFYCGTGWRASIPFLICYENGVENVTMYDGGWFVWQMHDDYPVQVGDPAGADCEHTTVATLPTDMAKS